jgi:hypothetical protein
MHGVVVALSLMLFLLSGCATPQPPRVASAPTAHTVPGDVGQATAAAPAVLAPAPRPLATGTPEDARRHMVRGTAAIEMAKSDAELAGAAEEFRIATEIDSTMAAAWFNLGAVLARMNQHKEAISSYNEYLALSPNAEDAPRIRDEVIKLQYRQEQLAKTQSREGWWLTDDGSSYWLDASGDQITLATSDGYVPEDEVITTYTIGPSYPVSGGEKALYKLSLRGNQLNGIWTREPLKADKCEVPGETTEVSGELHEREGIIVLRHARTRYRAATKMSLGSDYCGEVAALGKKDVEKKFYGPLPMGGIGVTIDGLRQWWDGGFSVVQFGWQGRLAIRVTDNSPAHAAGFRDKDEILAIDGVPVRDLSAGQAVLRMRGQPGTPLTLTVWRKGIKEPFAMTMRRINLAK